MSEVDSKLQQALRVCAACMYCDALCPVFPALTGKRDFSAADLGHLAHLCHNCGDCLDACQYATPHPFAVDLPQMFAAERRRAYVDHVWPAVFAPILRRPALGVAGFVFGAAASMLVLAFVAPPSFYFAASWLAATSLLFAVLSLSASSWRFWRLLAPDMGPPRVVTAFHEILTLRHLGGSTRRLFHHALVAGLALDLIATLSAAVLQHLLESPPPYALFSLPVLAGAAGGLAGLTGVAGLIVSKAKSEREPGEAALNRIFLSAIALVLLSGLLLLALRDTAALRPLLIIHIGLVCGFFLMLPASKLLHAPFRALALWRAASNRLSPAEVRRLKRQTGSGE